MTDKETSGFDEVLFFNQAIKQVSLAELEAVIAAAISERIGVQTKCSIGALEITGTGQSASLALKVSNNSDNPF